MRIDLHIPTTHTRRGSVRPEKAVAEAAARGVSVIAIADRHSVAGIDAATGAAGKAGIRLIPAVKFAVFRGPVAGELIAYFVRPDDPNLAALIERARTEKRLPAFEAIDRVRELSATPVLVDPHSLSDDTLADFAANGLDGIEVFRPNAHAADVARLVAAAERLDLLVTAGTGVVPGSPIGVEVDGAEALVRALDARRLPVPSPSEE